ncbi:hypothetical protein BTVI_116204 [Pitangus sulphuratus]|nr:hypothetical protein BTVI_116204 [Pitangus sulphuratus]
MEITNITPMQSLATKSKIQDNLIINQEQKEESGDSQYKSKAFSHHLLEQKECFGYWGISDKVECRYTYEIILILYGAKSNVDICIKSSHQDCPNQPRTESGLGIGQISLPQIAPTLPKKKWANGIVTLKMDSLCPTLRRSSRKFHGST